MDFCEYVENRDLNTYPIFKEGGPLLDFLDIELTERCNNNCIHCYINLPRDDAKARDRELSTKEWKDILNQAADIGVLTVRFTGGEPLLREDFTDLYLHARRIGMRVVLFTNARLITQELVDLFSRIPPLGKIEVTVYGMQAETYEAVTRSPGSYNESSKGIQLLLERNVPFIVKGALLPENKADREKFEEWAKNLPWMEGIPSYSLFFDLRGRRDSPEKNKRISRLRITPEEGLSLISRDEDGYRSEMAQFCQKFMGSSGSRIFSCGAGNKPCIDAYGFMQPCLLLRMPQVCYDLQKGSLREALTNFFPKVKEMEATNPGYLVRCARCFIKGLCGQCPARSWSEHGALDTPVEYLCEVAHAQARFLGLIEPGEAAWEVTNGDERVRRIAGGNK